MKIVHIKLMPTQIKIFAFVAVIFINLAASAVAATSPYNRSGTWSLVWADEFNRTSLGSDWKVGYRWGTNDSNMGNVNASNISLDGNYLRLGISGTESSYTVSGITTKASYDYCYFEARIKFAKGNGSWPAFWALWENASYTQSREIDFIEYLGNHPTYFYSSLHKDGSEIDQGQYTGAADLSSAFHVYAGYVTPTYIAYFLDGVEFYRTNRTDFNQAMNIMINQGIMGMSINWDGNHYDSSTFQNPPATLVDWFRIWTEVTPSSTPVPTPTTIITPTIQPSNNPTSTPVATVLPSVSAAVSSTPGATISGTPIPLVTKIINGSPSVISPTPEISPTPIGGVMGLGIFETIIQTLSTASPFTWGAIIYFVLILPAIILLILFCLQYLKKLNKRIY